MGLIWFLKNDNTDNIAPAAGKVDWEVEEYFGLRLDVGNVSLTICHFTSFRVGLQPGNRVARGDFLGTMKNHIHISLDDPYHDTSHSNCTPKVPRTCRPIPFNSGYFTIEGQSFDPGFDLNGNPLRDQWDGTTIVSTNQENK